MQALKARVRGGRLVLDEPTDLPEGVEIDLLVFDGGDNLDETERAALHASVEDGLADAAAGQVVDAAVVLSRLCKRT